MAGIVLRPRAGSIVTPAASTATPTTANQPLITTLASRAPKAIQFDKETLDEDPQQFIDQLNGLKKEVYEELAALRAFPFTRGVLLRDIRLPGCMGQVDSISTTTITLWHPYDALQFKTGDLIKAASTDGTTRGSIRNSGAQATVARNGAVAAGTVGSSADSGSVVATTNWTTAIADLVVGDFLFLSRRPQEAQATEQGIYSYFTENVDHRLGVSPKWMWAVATTKGSRQPDITFQSANDQVLTLRSTYSATVDLFVVG